MKEAKPISPFDSAGPRQRQRTSAYRNLMKGPGVWLFLITGALLALWIPVAVDKLWNLSGFHSTLLRQPIPHWWADVLFWLLPLLELAAAVLLAWPGRRKLTHLGMWLSAMLMLAFTLFILFGVLGWYDKRPCGCGSVISGLSWEQHLWFNATFLLLAVLGIRLTRPERASSAHVHYRKALRLFPDGWVTAGGPSQGYHASIKHIRFPRRMAVFRRKPW